MQDNKTGRDNICRIGKTVAAALAGTINSLRTFNEKLHHKERGIISEDNTPSRNSQLAQVPLECCGVLRSSTPLKTDLR
jgi:hypothetical protein